MKDKKKHRRDHQRRFMLEQLARRRKSVQRNQSSRHPHTKTYSHNGHHEDKTTAFSDRQINRGYGSHSDENDDSNFDAYDDFDGYENLDEQVDQKNAICSVVDVIPLLDSKAEELHNIFIEDKVKNSTANKIVKWFDRSYPNKYNFEHNSLILPYQFFFKTLDETPLPSVYQVDTLFRKDAPYAPYTVDCCQKACYAFQNTDESVCPECGSERYLQYLVKDLQDLATNGICVEAGGKVISFKAHLLGSFGDIPSVAEVNFLNSHSSKLGCRFCTFEDYCINHVVCFGDAANDDSKPVREIKIQEYKNGSPSVGVKKPSLFRHLPSFIHPSFVGLDEFHLFGQNMGPQIKKFFSSIKDSVYYLKPKICDEIGDCLAENSATMPLIFEGILIDVFSSGSRARGVDWLLFLKYFVGTVLVDYVGYKSKISQQEVVAEAKKALQAVSLICSICLQHFSPSTSTTWFILSPSSRKWALCPKSVADLWKEEYSL
ncbi:hypothetical protein [Parasitella parasitica]|uniref:Uncharacterized protein n=1 Tax=Parasitella parasitica TaxID=35722 RepID=A0A0B7MYE8_9FUNG|nr:hypothetical protein [Parasitella parasitica]